MKIPYSATPEEIAEYRKVLLEVSLFRLETGLQILAKVRQIQQFHEKNGK